MTAFLQHFEQILAQKLQTPFGRGLAFGVFVVVIVSLFLGCGAGFCVVPDVSLSVAFVDRKVG